LRQMLSLEGGPIRGDVAGVAPGDRIGSFRGEFAAEVVA
jgi:hypothetical protein